MSVSKLNVLSTAVLLLIAAVLLLQADRQMTRMNHRITRLEHACGPVDTGGGVTQCANPNIVQAPPTP